MLAARLASARNVEAFIRSSFPFADTTAAI
jgi:hypothetical protein